MMNNLQKFLTESSLSRIWSKFKDHDAGIITSFRGNKDHKTNLKNNKLLMSYLMSNGYSVTKVKGSYIENFGTDEAKEVSEDSFVVVDHKDSGNLKSDLIRMGKAFDQDSILFIDNEKDAVLIGTNNSDFPGIDNEVSIGKAKFGKDASEFFTRVNGRKFAFENITHVEELEVPQSPNSRLVMKKYLEEVERLLEEKNS